MNDPISEDQARQVQEFRNILYRSWPKCRDYSFTFTLAGTGWRIYINNSPDYGGRLSSSAASHRLDIAARPYICWSPDGGSYAAPIPTLSEAQGVAALWADCTENYIDSGRFEPAAGRPQVQDCSVLNGFAGPGARDRLPSPFTRAEPPAPPEPRRSSRWAEIRHRLFN